MMNRWICPKFPGRQKILKVIRGTNGFKVFREAESAKNQKKKKVFELNKEQIGFLQV